MSGNLWLEMVKISEILLAIQSAKCTKNGRIYFPSTKLHRISCVA